MNFTISQSLLLKNLNLVLGGISKNLDAFGGAVKIKAFNGKITLETVSPETAIIAMAECDIEREGEICAEAIKLFEIIKRLPAGGQIKIEQKSTLLHITHEKARFHVNAMDASQFPIVPLPAVEGSLNVRAKKLLFLIDKTRFSMFPNDTRLSLNGILLQFNENEERKKFLKAVATDGHRLSLAKLEAEDIISASFPSSISIKKGIIVPKKAILELRKILESVDEGEVEIQVLGKRISFMAGPFQLITTLVDAEFPNYEKVIPEIKENFVVIPRKELLVKAERVGAIYGIGDENVLRMTFENNCLTLFGKNLQYGEAIDEMPVEWHEDKMEIGYKYSYVVEILNHVSSDNVRMSLKQGSAALIKDEKLENYFYVLMPMRF